MEKAGLAKLVGLASLANPHFFKRGCIYFLQTCLHRALVRILARYSPLKKRLGRKPEPQSKRKKRLVGIDCKTCSLNDSFEIQVFNQKRCTYSLLAECIERFCGDAVQVVSAASTMATLSWRRAILLMCITMAADKCYRKLGDVSRTFKAGPGIAIFLHVSYQTHKRKLHRK